MTLKTNKKWKSRLLSSSLPLEFDVAKILYKYGSTLTYDYSYNRVNEQKENKEFSVDIDANCFLPLNNENKVYGNIDFLIECKYREDSKKWIFLPEINENEYTNVTMGYVTRYMPEFNTRNLPMDTIDNLEESFEYGFKGFEINTLTGEVADKDIRHGINQLKYALPYKIKNNIESSIWSYIEEVQPFFVYPILVTNAELFLLDKEFGVKNVKKSQSFDELGKKVPYIIIEDSVGPDFKNHHRRIFEPFKNIKSNSNNLKQLDDIQKTYGRHIDDYFSYKSSINKFEEIEKSQIGTMHDYYSKFIVCNFENFDTLINRITIAINSALKE